MRSYLLLSVTITAVFFLASACATVGKKFTYASSSTSANEVVVFVHGYYGANLNRKSDNERVWARLGEVLWNSHTLAIDPEGEMAIEGATEYVEDGLLERVPVFPGIYSIEGYGSVIDWLRSAFPHSLVIPFSYDWRQDNREAVHALASLVDQLKRDGKTVDIVAHSMGGLVASYYLRYGDQDPATAEENWQGARLVNRAVLAAVPFLGTMHLLRNMHIGVDLGPNKSLLKAEAVSSFPSSYQLLPPVPHKILDINLRPLEQDLFDYTWWDRENIGLMNTKNIDPIPRSKRVRYTRLLLARAKAFSMALNAPPRKNNPPLLTKILVVLGTSRKTIDKIVWVPRAETKNSVLIYNDSGFAREKSPHTLADLQADGDESVTRESATLPPAFAEALPHEDFITQAKHSEILADAFVQKAVENFLHPK